MFKTRYVAVIPALGRLMQKNQVQSHPWHKLVWATDRSKTSPVSRLVSVCAGLNCCSVMGEHMPDEGQRY